MGEMDTETEAPSKTKGLPNRVNFTPFTLKRLPTPPYGVGHDGRPMVKQVIFWDSSVPGFGLRISSSGAKSWLTMYRVLRDGQKRVDYYTLGSYAEFDNGVGLTLAQARQRAHEIRQMVAKGGDPKRMKEDAEMEAVRRSRNTFVAVAHQFLDDHGARLRPNTRQQYRRLLLGADCRALHTMPIMDIGRRDIIAVLDGIKKRGVTVTANRALAALQSLFGWAIQKGYIDAVPTDHVKRPCEEKPRNRHLFGSQQHGRPSELALAWRAFEQCGEAGALPQLLLLSAQRRDEVGRMQWTELLDLDGEDPRWVIPGIRTKNKKEHVVPLGPMAVQIIKSLTRFNGCKFVFTTDGRRARTGFSRLKNVIDDQIDAIKAEDPGRYVGQFVEPWTFHSLRHTVKTALAELGVLPDIRDALLAHSRPGLDAVYNHAEYSTAKRAVVLLWEKHIEELL